MSARIVIPAVCLSVVLSAMFAQTPEALRDVLETPPDTKAYNATFAIDDPEKKMEALLKFKADFPDSILRQSADLTILSTLVKKFPSQTARIRQFASQMYRKAPENSRGSVANQIALQLLGANLLLKDAESYAGRGVDAMVLSTYLRDQIAGYQKRDQTPPWTRDLEKRFRESRAVRVATLGRVALKLGRTAKAHRLLEEAYAATPENVTVQSALGILAAQAGNDSQALEYLIPAWLSGTAPPEAGAALESIYRKQHGDSLTGFEPMLDAEYHKRFPNPLHPGAYQPSERRSGRMVLAELFTGSACLPCAAADLAFDVAMERYSRKDLAVVMYHVHVPRPDPMTNPDTQARYKSYSVRGVPTFVIDGKKATGGGSRTATQQAYDRFNPDIEKALETPAEAGLKAEASLAGNAVNVKAAVDRIESDSKDLKVQIALVEKKLRFSGESGIRFHPMVVRAIRGFEVDPATPKTVEHSFDLEEVSKALKTHLDAYEAGGHRGETFTFAEKKYQIDRSDLAVVVFVQDDETKRVLQSAYVDLVAGPAVRPVTEANGSRQ